MEIKVELLEGGKMPQKVVKDQAAYDCYSNSFRWDMEAGYFEIGLGFSIEIPKGYVGKLYPRSSVSNIGIHLANSVGLIDPTYGQEVRARFYPSVIKAVTQFEKLDEFIKSVEDDYGVGNRCAQLRIEKDEEYDLVLGDVTSERGGFGSSGKN